MSYDPKTGLHLTANNGQRCRRAIWYADRNTPGIYAANPHERHQRQGRHALTEVLKARLKNDGWTLAVSGRAQSRPVMNIAHLPKRIHLVSPDLYQLGSHPERTKDIRVPLLLMALNQERYQSVQHLGARVATPETALQLAAYYEAHRDRYHGEPPWVATYNSNDHAHDIEPLPVQGIDLLLNEAAMWLQPLLRHLDRNRTDPPDRDFEAGSGPCERCPFRTTCRDETPEESPVPPWQETNPPDELVEALQSYQLAEMDLRAMADVQQAQNEAKAIIKSYMSKTNAKSVNLTTIHGKARITSVTSHTDTVNKKLARELLGTEWDRIATSKEYTYPRITLAKEPRDVE